MAQPVNTSNDFNPGELERPDSSLLKYYALISLLTGPGIVVMFLPLFFKYETLRYKFEDDGMSMSWGILFAEAIMCRLEKTTEWFYGAIWGVLTNWFRVPAEPPALPVTPGEHLQSFRPSEGVLRYLKFRFWVLLFIVDIALLIAWLVITAASLLIGLWLAPLALAVMVVPDIVAYAGIHDMTRRGMF